MFFYTKKHKYTTCSVFLLCLISLHQNNAETYYGWYIEVTASGIRQQHYSFEQIWLTDRSHINFHFTELLPLNPNEVGFPMMEHVNALLEESIWKYQVFPAQYFPRGNKFLPFNLSVRIYIGEQNIMLNNSEYVAFFINKVDLFVAKHRNDPDTMCDGITMGPITEATMLFFGCNFNLEYNISKEMNLVKLSPRGTTLVYVTTLKEFKLIKEKAKHIKTEMYYTIIGEIGEQGEQKALFATHIPCFNTETILKLSILHFITEKSNLVKIGKVEIVYSHPCFQSPFFIFATNDTILDTECLHRYSGSLNFKNQRYMIRGHFDFEKCQKLLEEVLQKPFNCSNLIGCWLNFSDPIFGIPRNRLFHLIGEMFDDAYAIETNFNLGYLKYRIQEKLKDITHKDPYKNAEQRIRLMFVLTFCKMLNQAFLRGGSKSIFFQPAILEHTPGGIFYDTRLWELLPEIKTSNMYQDSQKPHNGPSY